MAKARRRQSAARKNTAATAASPRTSNRPRGRRPNRSEALAEIVSSSLLAHDEVAGKYTQVRGPRRGPGSDSRPICSVIRSWRVR